MSNIQEFMKEVKTITQERDRLKSVVDGYVNHAQELIKMADDIDEKARTKSKALRLMAKEIDPYLGVKSGLTSTVRTGPKPSELIVEFFNLIKGGTQVNRDFMHKAYPELTKNNTLYILTRLATMPGVQKRKDGINVWLYM